MSGTSWLVVVVALITCHVVAGFLLHKPCLSCPNFQRCRDLVSHFWTLLDRLIRTREYSTDPSAPGCVQKLLRARQESCAYSLLLFLEGTDLIFLCWTTYAFATESHRWLSPAATIVFFVFSGCLLPMILFPTLIRATTLNCGYSLLMVFLILAVSPVNAGQIPDYFTDLITILRFASGFITTDERLMVVMNIIFFSVYVWARAPTQEALITPAILGQMCTTSCILFGNIHLKRILSNDAQMSVESTMAKAEHSAVTRLLGAMSEAVVELDHEHHIVGSALQLAGMLLLPSLRTLHGVCFHRFLANEDEKTHFVDQLATRAEEIETPLAHVFHLRLKDSLHNFVNVQVFHVRFQMGSGDHLSAQRHLVGIREFGDTEFCAPRVLSSPDKSQGYVAPRSRSEKDLDDDSQDICQESVNSKAGSDLQNIEEDRARRCGSRRDSDPGVGPRPTCTNVAHESVMDAVSRTSHVEKSIEEEEVALGDEFVVVFDSEALRVSHFYHARRTGNRVCRPHSECSWDEVVDWRRFSKRYTAFVQFFAKTEDLRLMTFVFSGLRWSSRHKHDQRARKMRCEISLTRSDARCATSLGGGGLDSTVRAIAKLSLVAPSVAEKGCCTYDLRDPVPNLTNDAPQLSDLHFSL